MPPASGHGGCRKARVTLSPDAQSNRYRDDGSHPLSQDELVAAARDGDQGAFEELVRQTYVSPYPLP